MSPALEWSPPPGWRRLTVIDSHAGGEPFRLVVEGLPDIRGDDMAARRRFAQENLDSVRKMLMWEPRGHADMYGGWVGSPVSAGADLSVLFTHNEGFSTMCGHGIIALVKIVLDTGMVSARRDGRRALAIDTPAGLVTAVAEVESGEVISVRFRNVPSFVSATDLAVTTPGFGEVSCDIAYGGAFYAFVDGESLGLEPSDVASTVRAGQEIKDFVSRAVPPRHPDGEELSFLYGTIFVFPPESESNHSRHICVFADGQVDRSPTGTGVSARLALLYAAGSVPAGEEISVESVVGSVFSGRIVGTTRVGELPAVIPEVGGSAHLTARSQLWFDPSDPLGAGFLLR